ncbi:MAG: phage holin family protein [Flavobacteriaceae bacterium]|nr:phage holin family protein [Flavobacteriaceae bacterium]
MNYILKLLLTALAVVLLSKVLPGVQVEGYTAAIWVALTLSILNVLVKPLLVLFTLPITVVTFGLFLLIINALIILLADKLLDGFAVSSIWIAILFSVLLSILQSILFSILKKDKEH